MIKFFQSNGKAVFNKEIENYLKQANVILPLEYKNFLQQVNGGITRNQAFELARFDIDKKNLDFYVDIDKFFSLETLKEIWEYTEIDLGEFDLFPIAEVRGGMIICCKQEGSIKAKIYFFDNNTGATKLTDSLIEFLNLLIPESEVDFKKYGINY